VAKRDDEVWTLAMEIGGTGMTASVLTGAGRCSRQGPGQHAGGQNPRTDAAPGARSPRSDAFAVRPRIRRLSGRRGWQACPHGRESLPAGWIGFELGRALEVLIRKPVRVANDVALQGLAAVRGQSFELVITLAPVRSALYIDGLVPQFSLSGTRARPHMPTTRC
jgi:hypothetical protein